MWVWKCLVALAGVAPAAFCADLLIENVTVIDVVTGARIPQQSILIHQDKIAAVGDRLAAPKGAEIVNGAGRYAIPGLWDMHVHLWHHDHQFPLFLANGVTGVRDMGSDLTWVNQWREQIRAGKLLGPRIETSGPAVDGAPSEDPKLPVFVVKSPHEGRAIFDRLDNLQVDFIEVMPGVPRDAYFALIERARKYDLAVAGNVPESVRLSEAIDARQKSIEHMSGILLACSSREDHLRSREILAHEKKDWRAYGELQAEALGTFDPRKANELFARMAIYDMREVPTLVMLRRTIYADAAQLATSPHLAYISPLIRKAWTDPRVEKNNLPEEAIQRGAAEYEKLRSLVPQMHRAGVMIMAGTDTGFPYTFPGFDLHRELELLVDAGLTPLDALRAATIEPAKYLGATGVFGAIKPDLAADLVLLDADPLQDIRNTQRIHAVIVAGQYLSKSHLNGLLAGMKKKTPPSTARSVTKPRVAS